MPDPTHSGRTYNTLDELAEDFKPGERFRYHPMHHANPNWSEIATVLGYVYSLPLEPGGRDEPALVVETQFGLGNVYPFEVVKRVR